MTTTALRNRPDPYDPICKRYAKDMEYLDTFWAESQRELHSVPRDEYPNRRRDYIVIEEGTYNRENGHFLCDSCYIKAGMPVAPGGWICP